MDSRNKRYLTIIFLLIALPTVVWAASAGRTSGKFTSVTMPYYQSPGLQAAKDMYGIEGSSASSWVGSVDEFLLATPDFEAFACSNGEGWSYSDTAAEFVCASIAGVTDHGALTGLDDDDHELYATTTELAAVAASQHSVVTALAFGAITGSASDAQIPDDITVSALAADPSNCSAGSVVIGIDASGEPTCVTDANTGTTYSAGDGIALADTQFSADASTHITVTSGGISVNVATLEAAIEATNLLGASGTVDYVLASDGSNGLIWKEDATSSLGTISAIAGTNISVSGATVSVVASPLWSSVKVQNATTTVSGNLLIYEPQNNGTNYGKLIVAEDLTSVREYTFPNATGTVALTTGSNVATASALAANPTNCSAGSYARGITAAGVAEDCTADADTNTHLTAGGGLSIASSVITLDALTGGWAVAGTSFLATPGTYPVPARASAITITSVRCITDTGTVIIDLQEGTSTSYSGGTDVTTSPITCDSDSQTAATISNAVIDADDWMAIAISTDASDPTTLGVTWYYTIN